MPLTLSEFLQHLLRFERVMGNASRMLKSKWIFACFVGLNWRHQLLTTFIIWSYSRYWCEIPTPTILHHWTCPRVPNRTILPLPWKMLYIVNGCPFPCLKCHSGSLEPKPHLQHSTSLSFGPSRTRMVFVSIPNVFYVKINNLRIFPRNKQIGAIGRCWLIVECAADSYCFGQMSWKTPVLTTIKSTPSPPLILLT